MLAALAAALAAALIVLGPAPAAGASQSVSKHCTRAYNTVDQINIKPNPGKVASFWKDELAQDLWQIGSAGDCSDQCAQPAVVSGPNGAHMTDSPETFQPYADPQRAGYKPAKTPPTDSAPACVKISHVLALSSFFDPHSSAPTPGAVYLVWAGADAWLDAVGNVPLCDVFFTWDGGLSPAIFDATTC